jgi:hypothetical protein
VKGWNTFFKLTELEQEKALVLWANSTRGLLLHWWHANKQQAGRGSIGVSALGSLPVLDVTKLSPEALARAVAIFEDLKRRPLRPINEIDRGGVRHELDTRLTTEVLGFPPELVAPDGPLALLRQKLALEPSIAGGEVSWLSSPNNKKAGDYGALSGPATLRLSRPAAAYTAAAGSSSRRASVHRFLSASTPPSG